MSVRMFWTVKADSVFPQTSLAPQNTGFDLTLRHSAHAGQATVMWVAGRRTAIVGAWELASTIARQAGRRTASALPTQMPTRVSGERNEV